MMRVHVLFIVFLPVVTSWKTSVYCHNHNITYYNTDINAVKTQMFSSLLECFRLPFRVTSAFLPLTSHFITPENE